MKVLILSCATGGGHNSAAAALCEYFEKQGCECDVVNALGFLPKARADFISRGHELMPEATILPDGTPCETNSSRSFSWGMKNLSASISETPGEQV